MLQNNIENPIYGFTDNVVELLRQLKNNLIKIFQRKAKNNENSLNTSFDNLRDCLLSYDELSDEFIAFTQMRKYLKYILIDKPDNIECNERFINNAFNTFSDLLNSKLNYLMKKDEYSKKEYLNQCKIFKDKYYEYRKYFNLNIYENNHEFDKQTNEIGNIILMN